MKVLKQLKSILEAQCTAPRVIFELNAPQVIFAFAKTAPWVIFELNAPRVNFKKNCTAGYLCQNCTAGSL